MARRVADRLDSLGLAPRLLLNNLLVIVAGAGTVLVTALMIARPVFARHLERAHLIVADPTSQHITTAFDQAVFTALAVGIVTAGIAAAAISWLVARRLARPVQEVADATRRLAEGKLEVHVPDPHMGPEFATLTSSVNTLAERLASTESSRRQLTADLAHQLRTPIASMEATITAVKDGVLPVDTTTLDTLTEQSARLHRLVSDLEVVSRAQERQLLLNPEPVRVDTLVKTAVDAQRERFRAADVALNATIAARPLRVRADADRLQEVLANLLDNALRHTPAGGTVSITAQRQDSTTGHLAIITITDTGQGFQPEMAERIFHRFQRGPSSTGSGLGLTIARAIAEAHHGTLTAASQGADHGTTFTLVLPSVTD